MLIIFDDKEVDFELPKKDVKLKQVLDEVEDFLFQVGKIPVSLSINDQELAQEDLDKRENLLLTGDEKLRFGVISIFEFINVNLDGAASANQELMKSIKIFAEEIHSAEKSMKPEQIVEEVNHFFDFWIRMNKLIPEEFAQVSFAGKDFKEVTELLQALFEESLKAMEGHDFVLAADLLQYEIVPVVEQIDQVIPELKAKVSESEKRSEKDEKKESNKAGVN